MKAMINLIIYTLFISSFSVGCVKDIETKSTIDIEYESCCGSDPVEATVRDSSHIYVPNAFTPNGDGLNDKFRPYYDGEIKYFEYMFIYTLENDTLLYKLDGSLFIGQEDTDFGWDGKRWETNELTKHKGGFRYEIHFPINQNYNYEMKGIACSILCDEGSKIFKDNDACFFPEQHGNGGQLNKDISNTETDCFE